MTRKIITTYAPPPIPPRQFDWCAYEDGNEEGAYGYGATEAEAIADLEEQLEPNSANTADSAASRTLALFENSLPDTAPQEVTSHPPADAEPFMSEEWDRLHEADDDNCADFDPVELFYGCR